MASLSTSLIHSVVSFLKRYRENKTGMFGLIVVAVFVFVAVVAPLVAPYDPWAISRQVLASPSIAHLFGTDDLGRDILSGVVYGARGSLYVGFVVAAISTLVGIAVGVFAGYYGRWVDDLLMRITELFQSLPRFFFVLVFVSLLGRGLDMIIISISLCYWTSGARLVRSEFLSLKEREFVSAARTVGLSDTRIIFSEILPNMAPTIIANATLMIAQAIIVESGLSFLGLSDPNFFSWGYMLNNAQMYLVRAWWTAVFPGVAIFLVTLGSNLVGGSLSTLMDPKLRTM